MFGSNWYDFKRLAFMNCPLCGEVCRCPLEPLPAALQGNADVEVSDLPVEAVPQAADAPAWLPDPPTRPSRYRARRKLRPPRYPSLSLKFDAPDGSASANTASGSSLAEFEPISSNALALDGMRRTPSVAAEPEVTPQSAPAAEFAAPPARQPVAHASAKIIEFRSEERRVGKECRSRW